MRKVPTPSGRFAFQLYFDDVGEIDEICLEALKKQSLLAPTPTPIRIERFVEKQFRTTVRYEDLGPDNLGCTIFNSSGAVEENCAFFAWRADEVLARIRTRRHTSASSSRRSAKALYN